MFTSSFLIFVSIVVSLLASTGSQNVNNWTGNFTATPREIYKAFFTAMSIPFVFSKHKNVSKHRHRLFLQLNKNDNIRMNIRSLTISVFFTKYLYIANRLLKLSDVSLKTSIHKMF